MRTAVALLMVCLPTATMADQFYLTVGLNCDLVNSQLVVSFRGAWNEEGEKAVSALGKSGVDPRELVVTREQPNRTYSYRKKTRTWTCLLGDRKYKAEISPLMAPGFGPAGFCASRIGASVVVKLKGKPLAREGTDACTEKGLVTTEIVIKPNRPPSFEKVAAERFYGH